MFNFKYIHSELGVLRVYEDGDSKWFATADICKMIGYRDSGKFLKVDPKELKKIQHKSSRMNIVTSKGLAEFFELNKRSKQENFKLVRRWAAESNFIPNYIEEEPKKKKEKIKTIGLMHPVKSVDTSTLGKVISDSEFGKLEVIEVDNEIYFPSVDAAKVLGYKDPRKTINAHCIREGFLMRAVMTNGGEHKKKYINEDNLYRLILRSRRPDALEFIERLLFEELLPNRRR
ncbi:BRO family protein [Bacillus wiedmannii]|uniref:BRO family protein n=1 Tax=Bacillus wiedmannii TaxID=1890302 RepID=UPI000BEFFC90|nr:BRO family protein [Bacillus wiedmannii]PEM30149.1 hypothetical protein CN598_12525 [Bacillus wiedmannii]